MGTALKAERAERLGVRFLSSPPNMLGSLVTGFATRDRFDSCVVMPFESVTQRPLCPCSSKVEQRADNAQTEDRYLPWAPEHIISLADEVSVEDHIPQNRLPP